MKRITLIFLSFIFYSPMASAWTINADFEGGTIGSPAEGKGAFATSRDNTFFSNTYTRNGSLSAKASISKGETGGMGGTFFPNVEPSQGDEIWWSCSVFFPTGFNFTVGGSGLKLMRAQVKSSSNVSQGYHNMLLKQNGLSINSALSADTFTTNNPERHGLGGSIATNKWHTFETYFKFNATQGIWRIWKDGKLIFEDKKTFTLKNSSDKVTRGLVFTYWNDGAPASQSAYIDDCVMTSDTPPKYDAEGNSFIGVGAASGVAPPMPPVILK